MIACDVTGRRGMSWNARGGMGWDGMAWHGAELYTNPTLGSLVLNVRANSHALVTFVAENVQPYTFSREIKARQTTHNQTH